MKSDPVLDSLPSELPRLGPGRTPENPKMTVVESTPAVAPPGVHPKREEQKTRPNRELKSDLLSRRSSWRQRGRQTVRGSSHYGFRQQIRLGLERGWSLTGRGQSENGGTSSRRSSNPLRSRGGRTRAGPHLCLKLGEQMDSPLLPVINRSHRGGGRC